MYYSLEVQRGTKETGNSYPQLTPYIGGHYKDKLSSTNLSNDYPLENTSTKFELDNGAKLTDLLSCGHLNYFVLNQKTKLILEEFNLFNCTFIETSIKGQEISKHFILYPKFSKANIELIDFEKTIFAIVDPDTKKIIREFQIDSNCKDKIKEWQIVYQNLEVDYYEIEIKELYLSEVANEFDLIYLSPFFIDKAILISKKLALKILESKLSGVSISNVDCLKE
jgi:hypothetical protein